MSSKPLPSHAENLPSERAKSEDKPSRFSIDTITGGAPVRRFNNDYGKGEKHPDETGLNILPIGTRSFPIKK